MYWNTVFQNVVGVMNGWIVTLDVLKYEWLEQYEKYMKSWIVTLDVLK